MPSEEWGGKESRSEAEGLWLGIALEGYSALVRQFPVGATQWILAHLSAGDPYSCNGSSASSSSSRTSRPSSDSSSPSGEVLGGVRLEDATATCPEWVEEGLDMGQGMCALYVHCL